MGERKRVKRDVGVKERGIKKGLIDNGVSIAGAEMSIRRRAYSTNQIEDYNPLKKVYTPSDPSSAVGKNPLRRAKVQELISQASPEHGAQWKMNYQVSDTLNHMKSKALRLFIIHFIFFCGNK